MPRSREPRARSSAGGSTTGSARSRPAEAPRPFRVRVPQLDVVAVPLGRTHGEGDRRVSQRPVDHLRRLGPRTPKGLQDSAVGIVHNTLVSVGGFNNGSGPGGRIVRADLGKAAGGAMAAPAPTTTAAPAGLQPVEAELAFTSEVPHDAVKLSNMRKTIARRLTESKQQIPHIYLTVDIQLDASLA